MIHSRAALAIPIIRGGRVSQPSAYSGRRLGFSFIQTLGYDNKGENITKGTDKLNNDTQRAAGVTAVGPRTERCNRNLL